MGTKVPVMPTTDCVADGDSESPAQVDFADQASSRTTTLDVPPPGKASAWRRLVDARSKYDRVLESR